MYIMDGIIFMYLVGFVELRFQLFDLSQINKVFRKSKTSWGLGPDSITNQFLKIAITGKIPL